MFDEFAKFGTSNTVCTVNGDGAICFAMLHRLLEGSRKFLVVSVLANIAVRVLCPLGIHTTDEVVQLRCREKLVIGVFGIDSLEGIYKTCNKGSTGCACITGEDDASMCIRVDLEVGLKFLVLVDQVLIRRCIG